MAEKPKSVREALFQTEGKLQEALDDLKKKQAELQNQLKLLKELIEDGHAELIELYKKTERTERHINEVISKIRYGSFLNEREIKAYDAGLGIPDLE